MGARGLVHTWAVDTSGERTCVVHWLHWWEDQTWTWIWWRREKKAMYLPEPRRGNTHTHAHTHTQRGTRHCVRCLSIHPHASIHIASLQTVAEITGSVWSCIYSTHYFLKDGKNQGKKEKVSKPTRLSLPSLCLIFISTLNEVMRFWRNSTWMLHHWRTPARNQWRS